MSSLSNSTQACVTLFASLCAKLPETASRHLEQMPLHALDNEFDRFKIWSGNLGARQSGHASLDWRLRDAATMSTSISKLLGDLKEHLQEGLDVVAQTRLPYEEQGPALEDVSSDTDSDISVDNLPELAQRLQMIVAIVKSLYRLSFMIRRPGIRLGNQKAALIRGLVPGSTIEYGEAFEPWDRSHVAGILKDLQKTALTRLQDTENTNERQDTLATIENALTDRLTRAITKRRRQFKYWANHRQKLAMRTSEKAKTQAPGGEAQQPDRQPVELSKTKKAISNAPTQSQGPAETEASRYLHTSSVLGDAVSIAPSISTARDLEGQEAAFPPPPEVHGSDFECPYCFVLCPAKEATRSRWRKHISEDLQPYSCTYLECKIPDQLYGSRTTWLNHEDTFHRQAWRCRDHQGAMFLTEGAFVAHLGSLHPGLTVDDVQALLDMSLAAREDTRECCPLCFIPVVRLARGQNLLKHIANHMERVACFALPRDVSLEGDLEYNESLRNRFDSSDRSDDSRLMSDYDTASDQSEADAPPLYRESCEDSADRVKALLDAGADVNARGGKYGNALQAASYNGHTETVEALLEHYADVNAQGGVFGTALYAASFMGHRDIVEVLLKHHADINAQGGNCGNALQAASYSGHKDVVQLLLDWGADINVQGGRFGGALQAAAAQGHEAVVRILLERGADVNAEGGTFNTALQAASQQGHITIVKLLLDYGANVNAQGGKLGCALQAACLQDNEALIRLLLDRGADVNLQGGRFGSALQAASVHGDETVVRLLLDSGAHVNMKGDENKRALQIASAAGHETVVRMLLDLGAVDVDSEGVHDGAYRAALDAGYENVAQLLQPDQPLATADRRIVLDVLSANTGRPLWLLNTDTMTLVKSPTDTPYAIISHTYGRGEWEEAPFQEVCRGKEGKHTQMGGWSKIVGACKQASQDGLQYLWADSCCIDRSDAAEVQEAIISMFDYYRGASVCYVYMADVDMKTSTGADIPSAFSESRWHTRGWTLQELLAPKSVEFYDRNWTFIGTLSQLVDIVVRATGIPGPVLRHETALQDCSVAQRLSWAANRQTTRSEDNAYALLGIFGVYMPLMYGEGTHAFVRLQEELLRGDDLSVLAWGLGAEDEERPRLLATSLADFRDCGDVVATKTVFGTFEIIRTISSLKIREAEDEIVYVRFIATLKQLGTARLSRRFGWLRTELWTGTKTA
ncbi:hypothetical protein LTS10_004764 [Elasticomyces elasticus]|nr:hypothetical protein LTS10_004764 [Elasticomyces elasticus]